MKRPLASSVLLAWVCLGTLGARAEQLAPRDIWPQATAAIDSGDIAGKVDALAAAAQCVAQTRQINETDHAAMVAQRGGQ
jgi:hypothetical protein